ncbi:MAG TPA: hypothetical protein VGI35_03665, partial [Steroidobacteraceae bacterium]
MKCPKCGHEQDDAVQCGSCGVYFAKLAQQQAPSVPRDRRASPESRPSGFGPGVLALAVIATAAIVYGAMRHRTSAPAPQDGSSSGAPASDAVVPGNSASPRAANLSGLGAQLARSHPARNAIETARNATVFIKTGWGLGSGFIVDDDCHVITNRHVVESDGARVAANVTRDPQFRAGIASARQQLQTALNQARRLRRSLEGEPGTNLEQIELDDKIAAMEEQLANLPERVDEAISAKVQDSARTG